MDYIYKLTGWKNGNEKKYVRAKTENEADKIAFKMISGRYGFNADAVDICELDKEGRLHSKTIYTLCGRNCVKTNYYIGEDD